MNNHQHKTVMAYILSSGENYEIRVENYVPYAQTPDDDETIVTDKYM